MPEDLTYPIQWRVLSEYSGYDRYKTSIHLTLTSGYEKKTLCGKSIPKSDDYLISVWVPDNVSWLCQRCEAAQARLEKKHDQAEIASNIRSYVIGCANVNIIEIMEQFNISRQKAHAILIGLKSRQDKAAKNIYWISRFI